MKTALTRALFPALSLLTLMVAFEVLSVVLREPDPNPWRRTLIELGSALGVSAIGFVGAAAGFLFLPAHRVLTRPRLVTISAVFALPAFLGLVPTFYVLGSIGTVVALAAFAIVVSLAGGYVVSRNAV